ncbi:hypothetical protein D9M72_618200 [compost metagenome]
MPFVAVVTLEVLVEPANLDRDVPDHEVWRDVAVRLVGDRAEAKALQIGLRKFFRPVHQRPGRRRNTIFR